MLPEPKTNTSLKFPELGRLVLNRTQMRAYDALAISHFKLPGILLMENAGRSAAELAGRLLGTQTTRPWKIVIVCGNGNNGGDGFVLARHLNALHPAGIQLSVFVSAAPQNISGDAKVHLEALLATGQSAIFIPDWNQTQLATAVHGASLVIDAIFGTGLNRPVDAMTGQVIETINAANGLRLALDVPSGLDADTGEIPGATVRATHTITFAHAKPGLLTPRGSEVCGLISVVNIGFDDAKLIAETSSSAEILTVEQVSCHLQPRLAGTHKKRSGDVMLFAGSEGKTGAAHLSALAALRAGAGLATVATWDKSAATLARAIDEVMLSSLSETATPAHVIELTQGRHAVAVGPGFGLNPIAKQVTLALWKDCLVTLVVDADGLTNLAGAKPASQRRILTPHAGEMGRLLGCTSAEVERDRYAAVRSAAQKYNAVVVLKGAHTLVASPSSQTFVSPWANAALATAGSGDVLTGLICALAANLEPLAAASCGVYVHGLAAHLWTLENQADRGMVASDLVSLLPRAIAILTQHHSTASA